MVMERTMMNAETMALRTGADWMPLNSDEEVLQIQHCAAEDGETVPCPDIVAQHAGQ